MSAVEYVATKSYCGTCKYANDPKHLCGICFWNGVTMTPENAANHKCQKCKHDTDVFKRRVFDADTTSMTCTITCSKHCVWFDWFHGLRTSFCGNKEITYL